jgi:hypothetical protein
MILLAAEVVGIRDTGSTTKRDVIMASAASCVYNTDNYRDSACTTSRGHNLH